MAKGGYRKPTNPAQVSGPGALSRRTDGNQPVMEMTGGKYGESKELTELQQGASMMQAQQGLPSMPSLSPLFNPTERPDEPVTAGMPIGPGANSIPGGNAYSRPNLRATLEKALSINSDPDLEVIYNYLTNRGVI